MCSTRRVMKSAQGSQATGPGRAWAPAFLGIYRERGIGGVLIEGQRRAFSTALPFRQPLVMIVDKGCFSLYAPGFGAAITGCCWGCRLVLSDGAGGDDLFACGQRKSGKSSAAEAIPLDGSQGRLYAKVINQLLK